MTLPPLCKLPTSYPAAEAKRTRHRREGACTGCPHIVSKLFRSNRSAGTSTRRTSANRRRLDGRGS
ncbi:hypothetical protein BDV93DRAFT_528157 [Ceratobasidium sp. AG-I]|nr:hypothetical protein BDV93DRAFT_528157 [Ceratobasidium sp. AG-I]